MKKKISSLLKIKYVMMILTILLLASIVLTYSFGGNISTYKNGIVSFFSPLRETVAGIGDFFKGISEERSEKEKLQEEIDRLTAENTELTQKLEKYKSDIYELAELRELLQLQKDYSAYDTLGASVIAQNTGNWMYEFTIDKGSDDGVMLDMNVLAGGALAGIVTDVGRNYSVVTSILADDMNVSAISSTTRDSCIVSGDLELLTSGMIRVMYVHKDAQIQDYDRIITSATSSKYLPHILIGYVKGLSMDSNDMTKSGYLIPALDFQHLEDVVVVLKVKHEVEEQINVDT